MIIARSFSNIFKSFSKSKQPIYLLSLMFLFWAIYEGIISYMTPLIISSRGISEALMGIIIGSSSVAGAVFDFVACRIFKNTYYKRIFMIMFSICLVYPLILSRANTFVLYLLAMSIWGVYYDLKNIGSLDFVGRHTAKDEHVSSFGFIQVAQSVGFLIAPILVGFLVADGFNYRPLVMAWIFLAIAVFFFALLYLIQDKKAPIDKSGSYGSRNSDWRGLLLLWGDLGKILFPVLLLTLMLNVIDSFFWTLGPIFAESLSEIGRFAGLFMTAYSLPSLFVGWLAGSLARRHGKKRTAFVSLLLGSLCLSLIAFIPSAFLMIVSVFAASFFISMAWPSIQGAYADYISETPKYEKEITGVEDFFTNLGYVLGPILAGLIASRMGNASAFSILGFSGIVIASLLLVFTPRRINVSQELAKMQD